MYYTPFTGIMVISLSSGFKNVEGKTTFLFCGIMKPDPRQETRENIRVSIPMKIVPKFRYFVNIGIFPYLNWGLKYVQIIKDLEMKLFKVTCILHVAARAGPKGGYRCHIIRNTSDMTNHIV